MRFSRSFERSVLIYRETVPPGRVLLHLGRTYKSGESVPEKGSAIPDTYALVTAIQAKDSQALLRRLKETFSDFVDAEDTNVIDALLIDYPELRARLDDERAQAGEDSALLRRLETALGAAALDAFLDLPVLRAAGSPRRRQGPPRPTHPIEDDPRRPWGLIAIGAFVVIVVLPLTTIALVRPAAFGEIENELRSYIISYGARTQNPPPAEAAPGPALTDEQAAFLASLRARKIDMFEAARFGPLTDTQTVQRPIGSGGGGTPSTPAGTDAPDDGDPDSAALPLPQPDDSIVTRMAPFGLPVDIGPLRVVALDTDIAPRIDTTTSAASGSARARRVDARARYDIRRGVPFILDARADDMTGLAPALDTATGSVCAALGRAHPIGALLETTPSTRAGETAPVTGAKDQDTPASATGSPAVTREVTLKIRTGRSDLAAVVLNPDVCAGDTYEIIPLFDLPAPAPESVTTGDVAAD